ncbi:MAG: 30S ribosomal protein S20 [candidate division TM6 bacterium GW2011_GWF2_43_17]|nr:MAG: 30S ribosomal protein S20 [candidate division TM6 bacterium GW2011_GWF2_43_17]HAU30492.1 30S ribosomal protein S20 [Candidatus Dependentiae bacterium]
MANTKSAKKNVRKSANKRLINLSRKTAIKTAVKKVHVALAANAGQEQAEVLLRDVAARLARAKSKGLLHPNAAARRLSRLAKRVSSQYRA